MADPKTQISVAIVDEDDIFLAILVDVLRRNDSVSSVLTFRNTSQAKETFDMEEANSLIIDLFTVGPDTGISLIEHLRENHKTVPICLIGEQNQLLTMPNIPENWRQRLFHYYKMQKDQLPDNLWATAQTIVSMLKSYWLTGQALVRIKELRKQVFTEHHGARGYIQKLIE